MTDQEVIIVDDDEMVIFLHKIILKEAGLTDRPVTATNGKEALEYMVKNPKKDEKYLLFLDINMPDMNGWEFLDELKRKSLEDMTRIIIVSSSIDAQDKKRSWTYSNVVDFVEKPLSTDYCKKLRK